MAATATQQRYAGERLPSLEAPPRSKEDATRRVVVVVLGDMSPRCLIRALNIKTAMRQATAVKLWLRERLALTITKRSATAPENIDTRQHYYDRTPRHAETRTPALRHEAFMPMKKRERRGAPPPRPRTHASGSPRTLLMRKTRGVVTLANIAGAAPGREERRPLLCCPEE